MKKIVAIVLCLTMVVSMALAMSSCKSKEEQMMDDLMNSISSYM